MTEKTSVLLSEIPLESFEIKELDEESLRQVLEAESLQFIKQGKEVKPETIPGLKSGLLGKIWLHLSEEPKESPQKMHGERITKDCCVVVRPPYGEAEPAFALELTAPQMAVVRLLADQSSDDLAFLLAHVTELLNIVECGELPASQESLRDKVAEMAKKTTHAYEQYQGIIHLPPGVVMGGDGASIEDYMGPSGTPLAAMPERDFSMPLLAHEKK